jgi:ATP-binding cassette, subfamily B, bacterial
MRTLKKTNKKPKYSILQNTDYVLKLIWKNDRILLLLLVLEALTSVLLPFFGIYLPKLVIDELVAKATLQHMIVTIGGFSLLIAAVYFTSIYVSTARYWSSNFMRQDAAWKLFEKTLHCDYENIESASGQTSYQKSLNSLSIGDWSGLARIIPSISGLAAGLLGFLLYSNVLAKLNLLVIILLIAISSINFFALQHSRNYEHSHKDQWASIDKKINYVVKKTSDISVGKDIRLYGMKNWFLQARDIFLSQRMEWDNKVANHHLAGEVTNTVIILIRDGLSFVYLIYMTSKGYITISELVLYFGAISGFSNWITKLINQGNEISSSSLQICDMREFLELENYPDVINPAPMPDKSKPISIEFRDVCFRYTGSDTDTLNKFNLKINPGEKVAVVGLNGAGKTTMVKLLCGFYPPDSGQILINGTDSREFKKTELFTLFSAVFQDITLLPFTAAENVALCHDKEIDKAKINHCLELAGLKDYFDKLPKGIDSMMLKVTQEDGILLSGGQQQKLLLARALYKNAPVLILDEPSAALDPIAESELYQRYHELTRNKTAIFISHRLASTGFCDRIAFIAEGQVSESGTHTELMEKNGQYAEMFEIQSHYYKENIVSE